jgi:hypothetical protein
MLGSRILNVFLRASQFICALIVMGLMAWFEHLMKGVDSDVDPQPQVIYTLVLAVISIIAAVILFIPFTTSMIHYVWDFIMMVGWFAAFGVLLNWYGTPECNGDDWCDRWKTAEAFSFISALLWLGSTLLGLVLVHNVRQGVVYADHPVRSYV